MDNSFRPLKILARQKEPVEPFKFVWHQVGLFYKAARLPFMTKLNPWFHPDKNETRWLPVNENLEADSSMPLPIELLDRFIDEASHRMVVDACVCRSIEGCKNYPRDIGCIMMGDGAMKGDLPLISREVTPEEAKAHARKAVDAGLVPMVGKLRLDSTLAAHVIDTRKLLTACFCCDCCCVTYNYRHLPLETLDPIISRLEGAVIEVTDDCTGCGKCIKKCYIQAITVPDGKAQISEYCRACGRCATVCPKNAIKVRLTDPEFLDKAYEKICAKVKHT